MIQSIMNSITEEPVHGVLYLVSQFRWYIMQIFNVVSTWQLTMCQRPSFSKLPPTSYQLFKVTNSFDLCFKRLLIYLPEVVT